MALNGARRIVKLWIFAHIEFLRKFQAEFGRPATPRTFLWLSRTRVGQRCIKSLFNEVVGLANDKLKYREYISTVFEALQQNKIVVTTPSSIILMLSVISYFS
jgi:hypothetical protein